MHNSLLQNTERFNLLPEDAKQAIQSFDYDTALKSIHDKYKLHIDQAAALEKAVADVVFGDMHSNELLVYIQRELRVDQSKATEIAVDINKNVLLPIQLKMREIEASM
jgi:hypothetical protein